MRKALSVALAVLIAASVVVLTQATPASAAGGCGAGYRFVDSDYGKYVGVKLYANLKKGKWCSVTVHAGKAKGKKLLTKNWYCNYYSCTSEKKAKTAGSLKKYVSFYHVDGGRTYECITATGSVQGKVNGKKIPGTYKGEYVGEWATTKDVCWRDLL